MFWFLLILLGILFVFSIFFFSLYPVIKKKNYKKNYVKIYGKKVYQIANKEDYYLLNNVKIKTRDDKCLNIDHILFGNKYFYLIKDYYLEGGLSYKNIDKSWIQYYGSNKKPKQRYIDNLMTINENVIEKFSQITGLDKNLFISIILINNDCEIVSSFNDSDSSYLIQKKNSHHLITNIEKRDVSILNPRNLQFAVRDINKLNLNKKKNK